jgi:hypothetical protein
MKPEVERIIATGDRADLKHWLATCSDTELLANWVKLSCCRVQDFQSLTTDAMRQRGIVRR